MKQINFKKFIPHLVGVILFAVLSAVYFYPVLEGYRIKQSDIKLSKGMSQEIYSHRDKFDEEPLWLGNMFGGMPAYQVSTRYPGNFAQYFNKFIKLGLPHPIGILFAYMIGFFIFSLSLKINPWISIVGAIAYGFSSYFIIILEAGHNTKAMAIAYVPPMLAGFISMYRGREVLGFLLIAVFLGLELYANHFQITYYSLIVVISIGIVNLIDYIKNKNVTLFLRRSGLIILATLLGVGLNIGNLLTTAEYAKSSTRSQSELTIQPDGTSNENVKSSGLDSDYITQWSYGKEETFSLLLSNIKGGGSGAIIGSEEEVDRLRKENPGFFNFLVRQYQENQNVINTYWGNQPFTSGPVYLGIIIFILSVLSFFFVKDKLVITLGIVSIISILLAWGKNYMGLTEFFIHYIPMYNKFRAVAMLLVIVEFTMPVLAVLFLSKLYQNREEILAQKSKLITVFSGLILIILLIWATPESFFDFTSEKEIAQFAQQIEKNPSIKNSIDVGISQLIDYRVKIVQADIFRAFQFLLVLIIVIGLYLFKKLNKNVLVLIIGALVLVDLWSVDKRYFNNEGNPKASKNSNDRYEKYELPEINDSPYPASPVDLAILQTEIKNNPEISLKINEALNKKKETQRRLLKTDIEKIQFNELMRNTHYRVLNTTAKMDEDAGTAYFHKTLGGYHAAKMKKYQELVDFQLGIEYYQLRQALIQGGPELAQNYLPQMSAVNMLNAKYIIGAINTEQGQQLTYIQNPYALGNAWLVDNYKLVANADEEISSLKEINPKTTVVIRTDENVDLKSDYKSTDNDQITLLSYLPNELKYSYNTSAPQLAVFSEIYYKDGWNVYINGEKSTYFKANYILRGMEVPKGTGEIIFKFEPKTYIVGQTISYASSVILILLVLGAIYLEIKKGSAKEVA